MLDGGVDTSFISNDSTLMAQSPARESVAKACSRCKRVEGTRTKSGTLVEFDIKPSNGQKFAQCRSCRDYGNDFIAEVNTHTI